MKKNKKIDLALAKSNILSDPDFIYAPKYDNSIKAFREHHPERVSHSRKTHLLMMSQGEIEEALEKIYKKLAKCIGNA